MVVGFSTKRPYSISFTDLDYSYISHLGLGSVHCAYCGNVEPPNEPQEKVGNRCADGSWILVSSKEHRKVQMLTISQYWSDGNYPMRINEQPHRH